MKIDTDRHKDPSSLHNTKVIFYREAVNDLETKLTKWLAKGSSQFDLQHDGDDYHLSLILSDRWNSQLYGLLCNKIQDYLVHSILNGWLSTFGKIQSPDYLTLAQQDSTDVERILLEQNLSFDTSIRGSAFDAGKKSSDGGASDSARIENNASVRIRHERMNLSGKLTPRDMNWSPGRHVIEPYDDSDLRRWIIDLQNRIKAFQNIIDNGVVVDEHYVHTDNNFTSSEKTKLASLKNYDDNQIRVQLNNKCDKIIVSRINFPSSSSEDMPVGILYPGVIVEATFVDTMTFTIFNEPIETEKQEYCLKFNTGATTPTLNFNINVTWSEPLNLEINKHYVVHIFYENGAFYGTWKSYDIAS